MLSASRRTLYLKLTTALCMPVAGAELKALARSQPIKPVKFDPKLNERMPLEFLSSIEPKYAALSEFIRQVRAGEGHVPSYGVCVFLRKCWCRRKDESCFRAFSPSHDR